MKRCMISQPRYLPALNYLQRIHGCDVFVLMDTVQHNKQDFEHRNRIACGDTVRWLSLPLDRSLGSRQVIHQLRLHAGSWVEDHLRQLRLCYELAPHFDPAVLELLYRPMPTESFVEAIEILLRRTFKLLGLDLQTELVRASALEVPYRRGPLYLVALCEHLGCEAYVSGPNGRAYIGAEMDEADMSLLFHDYDYPIYGRKPFSEQSWLAWIDAMMYQGVDFVRDTVAAPLRLSR